MVWKRNVQHHVPPNLSNIVWSSAVRYSSVCYSAVQDDAVIHCSCSAPGHGHAFLFAREPGFTNKQTNTVLQYVPEVCHQGPRRSPSHAMWQVSSPVGWFVLFDIVQHSTQKREPVRHVYSTVQYSIQLAPSGVCGRAARAVVFSKRLCTSSHCHVSGISWCLMGERSSWGYSSELLQSSTVLNSSLLVMRQLRAALCCCFAYSRA